MAVYDDHTILGQIKKQRQDFCTWFCNWECSSSPASQEENYKEWQKQSHISKWILGPRRHGYHRQTTQNRKKQKKQLTTSSNLKVLVRSDSGFDTIICDSSVFTTTAQFRNNSASFRGLTRTATLIDDIFITTKSILCKLHGSWSQSYKSYTLQLNVAPR